MRIEDYIPFVGKETVEEIKSISENLKDYEILHINSTYIGGGVAELLRSIVPLMNSIGLRTEWKIIQGDDEFFKITKNFHNAIHGENIEISQNMINKYLEVNKVNSELINLDKDFCICT